MSSSSAVVVLLRSASGPDDQYVTAFEAEGFRAQCEPVLTFRFPRPSALRDRLAHPERYAGLIVTSPRAVRAIERVERSEPTWAAWTEKPAYAVGPKTAAALRRLGCGPSGAQTGSAAALASVIVNQKKPYLFLSGNRRRATLPDALHADGIPFEECTVYETHLRTNIELPDPNPGDWLVFFSPSGAEALARCGTNPIAGYRLAAIGPTTAGALRERGWAPDAVAETPSPDGLVAAVTAAANAE